MGRLFTFIFLLFPALPAWALCEGTDLIADLQASARKELDARADSTPYGEGLFWRAQKGTSEITLFGTYHFHHQQTETHLELLKPHIDQADAIYLEVSTADQKQLQRNVIENPNIMFIMEGATLPDLLGDEDWDKLREEMRARGVPSILIAKFKPFWAAMILGIGPCETRAGLSGGKGIDEQIGDYAASIGKDSLSLEDYRTLLTLFDEFPLEDQLNMIRLFFAWAEKADDISYTLLQYYLKQKIALVWEYSRQISMEYGDDGAMEEFELFEQQLLVGRNAGWMKVIAEAAPDKSLFLAVGAGHLPGDNGLLSSLESMGYEITRLSIEP